MQIKGYELPNDNKFARAIKEVGEGASDELILAAYDRLGGQILKGNRIVKNETFYDVEDSRIQNKIILEKDPAIVFVYRTKEGDIFETEEDEEEADEVKIDKAVKKNASVAERDRVEAEAKARSIKFDSAIKLSALKKMIKDYDKKAEKLAKKEADAKEKEAKEKAKEVK